jgi:hypothetical protein
MTIKVRYSSIDHFRQTRTFKTLEGARKYAADRVGDNPDMGSCYAVSFDGIGKIEVDGCTLQELFYGKAKPAGAYEVWYWHIDEMGSNHTKHRAASFDTLTDAAAEVDQMEAYSDGVHIVGTTDEAKAALAAQHARYEAQCRADDEVAKAHWTDVCRANGEF